MTAHAKIIETMTGEWSYLITIPELALAIYPTMNLPTAQDAIAHLNDRAHILGLIIEVGT